MVAVGNRSGVSRWADHRSSKFAAWPVVSGAGVLASGAFMAGGISVMPEGAGFVVLLGRVLLSQCCPGADDQRGAGQDYQLFPQVFPPVSWVPEENAVRACRVPQVVWQGKRSTRDADQ